MEVADSFEYVSEDLQDERDLYGLRSVVVGHQRSPFHVLAR